MKLACLSLLVAPLLSCCISAQSLAQNTREEIADMLGSAVKIEEAALFAASFGTFKGLCDRPLENAGIIEAITRLEFGSLTPQDQDTYKFMMIGQYQGNNDIWKSLANKSAEQDFCKGLENTIIARAVDFMRLHPDLFIEKNAREIKQQITIADAVSQKMQNFSKGRKLYVFRMAENHVADYLRMLLKKSENSEDGYLSTLKVSAMGFGLMGKITEVEFNDIGAIYGERMVLYAKHIRGELDFTGLKTAEKANEKSKNEIYSRHFSLLQTQDPVPTPAELVRLNYLAKELAEIVIRQAK